LTRLKRSRQNRRRCSTHSHLRTSRDAWNHEKKKLGSLYTCPRGLLRRGRWNIGVRVINFFMVKFPELLGSTSYHKMVAVHGTPRNSNIFLHWTHNAYVRSKKPYISNNKMGWI
jgi:hypothetical protein